MVDRIRYPTVSYLPFYYVFFQFLLLTIFNLQANILTTKNILSNLDCAKTVQVRRRVFKAAEAVLMMGFSGDWRGNAPLAAWEVPCHCLETVINSLRVPDPFVGRD